MYTNTIKANESSLRIPVLIFSRCWTGSVLKQIHRQAVVTAAAELPCHPVGQASVAELHTPAAQRLIKVDGLEIWIQFKVQEIKVQVGWFQTQLIHSTAVTHTLYQSKV